MRTLKISLLVFILSITISAQEGWNDLKQKSNNSEIILLLKSTDYLFVDSAWQEDSRITYNYIVASLLLESKLYEVNNSGNWEYEKQHLFFYQSSQNPYEELIQDWNGAEWENHWKNNYTYNQLSQIKTILMQSYSFGNWVNSDSTSFSYNSFDSLGNYYSYRWDTQNWVNAVWSSYTYNVGGSLEERLVKSWSEFSNQWENSFRFTFFYNIEYNLSEIIYELWVNNEWAKQTKTEFIYDTLGYGYLTESYLYEWDENDWIESKRYTYDYDFFHLLHQLTEFNWNGSDWENYKKTVYDRIIVGVQDELQPVYDLKLFQNYPNPFNPVTKIKYSIPQSPLLGGDGRGGLVTLKVYDILGREVATLVNEEKPAGEYEVEFSVKGGSASGGNAYNLPSGIYFYQLNAGSYSETKKLVLLR